MKILHKYEDGTLKIAYNNGKIGLLPPVTTIDAKIVVLSGDTVYSVPIPGGLPAEIDDQSEPSWIRLNGTHHSEILFKIIVNAGMICARALGPEAIDHFSKCIASIKDILCKKETNAN